MTGHLLIYYRRKFWGRNGDQNINKPKSRYFQPKHIEINILTIWNTLFSIWEVEEEKKSQLHFGFMEEKKKANSTPHFWENRHNGVLQLPIISKHYLWTFIITVWGLGMFWSIFWFWMRYRVLARWGSDFQENRKNNDFSGEKKSSKFCKNHIFKKNRVFVWFFCF